jgi:hypothetical protein
MEINYFYFMPRLFIIKSSGLLKNQEIPLSGALF